MKKISEYRDEDALELLADIIEPATEIIGDTDVQAAFQVSKLKGASVAIKKHKTAVKGVLARLDGVPVEDYHCNVFTLPARLLEILNDEALLGFFSEQAQNLNIADVSGPASENTKDVETEKE